jgi:phage protein D
VAVADHQPPATLVLLGRMGGEIRVDLGFQGGGQHPPGALAHDRIQVQAQRVMRPGIGEYTQHAAFLPRRR